MAMLNSSQTSGKIFTCQELKFIDQKSDDAYVTLQRHGKSYIMYRHSFSRKGRPKYDIAKKMKWAMSVYYMKNDSAWKIMAAMQ